MKWSSAISESPSIDEAAAECASALKAELAGQKPDLVMAFVSADHAASYERVPGLVRSHLGDVLLIGCSGGGVIGAGREVEHSHGLALSAAILTGVDLVPFWIDDGSLPDGDAPPTRWESIVHASAAEEPQFVILADPFSIRGEDLLMGLDFAFPGSIKIGGLASGGHRPGGNALFLSDKVYRSGAVGISMKGNIVIDTIVAQGCRPVGPLIQVTACSGNVIQRMDGRSPLEVLTELYESLDEFDQQLARSSLFLGILMDELNETPRLGDFLIRNLAGVDPDDGWLTVGETLNEGQTVQFHVRDAGTSAKDLDAMLTRYADQHHLDEGTGGLLFSCLGRGAYLYGEPGHDSDMFRDKLGAIPLTGFFCNGEIGPVGSSTFLHGYTSSFGVFRVKNPAV